MAVRTKAAPASTNGAEAPRQPESGMSIVIPRIVPKIIELEIVGITPLIVQQWSEKARRQMLDKQMKKATRGKEAKDPQADYKNSRYISTEGWDGVPAGGVKGCLVNACRAVNDLPMTLAKRMVFVRAQGETKEGRGLVQIHGEHEMYECPVRIDSGGTADLRFRAMYKKWSMKLEIEFLENVISAEQVANLIELAGYVEGLCEHRPGSPKNNTGDFGRFMIKRDD